MFVIAIGIVSYLGYRAMYGAKLPTPQETSKPKQQLDNVRGAAKRIEELQQKGANDALEKANSD